MKGLMDLVRKYPAVNRFLLDYGQQLKKVAFVGVIVLVLLVVMVVKSSDDGIINEEEVNAKAKAEVHEETTGSIYVDIGGAVKNPMLAELPEGSRVEDAINAAGGIKEDADMTSINRAEFLEDGEKIYIPAFSVDDDGNVIAETGASGSSAGTSSGASGKVNINTADSTALQELNGVGPATAQKIIDYRESSGRFKSIEDIKNVSGIGDKTYEKLKDYITI